MKRVYFDPTGMRSKRLAHTKQARFAGGSGGGSNENNEWDEADADDADDADDDDTDEDEAEETAEETSETSEQDVELEQRKLLAKIRSAATAAMKEAKLNKAQTKQTRAIIDEALGKMNLNELKAFTDVKTSVRNLATKFEQFKTAQTELLKGSQEKRDYLKELVLKRMPDIERLYADKMEGRSIKLSVRAAEQRLQTRALPIMDTTNIITGDVDDVIDSFGVDAFIPKRRPRQYISDIADVTRVSEVPKIKIWEEEGPEVGTIAVIAEGELKPPVSLSIVRSQHEVRKAAGKIIFTEEVAKFKKRIFNILKELFNDKVYRDYQNILAADLVTAAATYPGSALDGKYAAPTDWHAIGAVASVIETLEFFPDTLIINPQDKWRMALSQTADGQFFVALPVMGTNGSISMAGFRVITTNKIAVGKFILGEAGLYKIEEEGVSLRMGYGLSKNATTDEYEDDFDHNRFRIIGEIFFHNYIPASFAGSFIMGDFAAIKTALTDTTP